MKLKRILIVWLITLVVPLSGCSNSGGLDDLEWQVSDREDSIFSINSKIGDLELRIPY